MNMEFEKKLTIPKEVKEMYPTSNKIKNIVEQKRSELKNIFEQKDSRLILIIGPCSADKEESVLDYINRLRIVQEKVSDKILIIPRLYTNKPRTTGQGYKGMVHQPDPNKKPDMFNGILLTRQLHMKAIEQTGFACADEMLYPENHRYLDDLLCYVTVGARSVEDQQHRLTASGLEIPVGMKNPTSGDISVMLNAIFTAQCPHTFIYRGWQVHSKGNYFSHAILRGFTNTKGENIPNYHYEDLLKLTEEYQKLELQNRAIIVDANHSNSNKNPFEQYRIAMDVLHSCKHNKNIKKHVKGFMIESYIEDGSQKPSESCYGKSITDPCLGWEKTEKLIFNIAENWQ